MSGTSFFAIKTSVSEREEWKGGRGGGGERDMHISNGIGFYRQKHVMCLLLPAFEKCLEKQRAETLHGAIIIQESHLPNGALWELLCVLSISNKDSTL